MDPVKIIIIRKLIENSANDFIYNDKNVLHADKERILDFFTSVQTEIKVYLKQDVKVESIRKQWYNMRKKFVDINLKKSLRQKVTMYEELFYEHLIFLENYISHKDVPVFKTPNQKDIIIKIFDLLMGNTSNDDTEISDAELNEIVYKENRISDENKDKNVESVPHNDVEDNADVDIEDYLDASSIYGIHAINECDTQDLDILEGYEDIVLLNLISNCTNEYQETNCTKTIPQEVSSCTKTVSKETIAKKKILTGMKYPVKPFNYQSISLPVSIDDQPKRSEEQLACVQTKNEQFMFNANNNLIKESINIFHSAIMDYKSEILQQQCLQYIINSINN